MRSELVFLGSTDKAVMCYGDRDLREFVTNHCGDHSLAKRVSSEIAHRAATVNKFFDKWKEKFGTRVLI